MDKTFIAHDRTIKPKGEKGRGFHHKQRFGVDGSLDRPNRCMVVDFLRAADITPILMDNIEAEAIVMTDEAGPYRYFGEYFATHCFTRYGAGQYVDR